MTYQGPHVWDVKNVRIVGGNRHYCDHGYHRGLYKCTNKGCDGWTYGDPVPMDEQVRPPVPPGLCAVGKKKRKKRRTKKTTIKHSPVSTMRKTKKTKTGGKSKRRRSNKRK